MGGYYHKSCMEYSTNIPRTVLVLQQFIVESTSLNDLVINIKLESSALIHGFVNTFLGHETQDKPAHVWPIQ
jgi:hypothetical protein